MAADSGKYWRLSLGYALAVAALVFAAHYLGVQGPQFLQAIYVIDPSRLALAFLLFTLSLVLNAAAFALANRAFGVSTAGLRLSGVWLATLLAKYVPVGIGHILGRGLMLSEFGIAPRTTVIVGVLEQGFSLLICAAIALAASALMSRADYAVWIGLAAVLGIGVLLSAAWAVRNRIGVRIVPLSASLLGYTFAMAPYAGAYVLLVEPASTLTFIQALFAGTVAGVLAIMVPGGLGVRESVIASMSSATQASTVLAGVASARALILLSECFGTLVGHVLLRRAGAVR
ncbi:hypothetical protein IEQ11_19560 [Lysobacter capsici]|uniref:hypothetical protein n=1 Tax=Lysobacter capsici TaxID=435897 RepID=UPI001783F1E9|nr:hypothetical protein [Lysobacter capsici]UOF13908.1 hypothetical protein IEQ11_19560 [Lysobacter capsici]